MSADNERQAAAESARRYPFPQDEWFAGLPLALKAVRQHLDSMRLGFIEGWMAHAALTPASSDKDDKL